MLTVDAVPTPAPTAAPARRGVALLVLCATALMVILDTTIVSVALPTIQADLGASPASLAWIVTAYLVAFGGLLLLAGRLGDLVGRRQVFLGGIVVFTLASVACGLAESAAALIVARFVQGAGGAFATAPILGMIVALFPERDEQARAMAAYAFVGAAGASLGLVAGGVLIEALDWHAIFFVNVPIGLLTFAGGLRLIERDPGLGLHRGADVPGAVLIVAALMLAVYAVAETAPVAGVGAALLLAAFVAWEARAAAPLVPLRVFRRPGLAAANAVQLVMLSGIFAQQFFLALYLQRVLGYGPVEVGLGVLPIALTIAVVSLGLSAKLIARLGARRTLLPGMALVAVSLGGLAFVPEEGAYAVALLPWLVLMGLGGGLALPALMTLTMAAATPDDAGLVSGLANTTQQIGGALGVAVLTSVASARTDDLAAAGDAALTALNGGYQLAFAVAGGLVAAALALAAVSTRS